MKPVTQIAHDLLSHWFQSVVIRTTNGHSAPLPLAPFSAEDSAGSSPGLLAIDATAGNGHDTLFLAQLVGPRGQVWAFDIQRNALQRTAARLSEHRISVDLVFPEVTDTEPTEEPPRVIGIQADHAEMTRYLPVECHGQIAAILFNLGYLPGGDKTCITKSESTLMALDAALRLLAPGSMLSVIVYPGHPGGAEEALAVLDWFACQADAGTGTRIVPGVEMSPSGPQLLVLQRAAS